MEPLLTITLTPREARQSEQGLEMLAMAADNAGASDEALLDLCALRSRFLDVLEGVTA